MRSRKPKHLESFAEVERAFLDVVNMEIDEIEDWLKTPESKSVGFVRRGESESVGRQSAKKIIGILRRNPSPHDEKHMRKVIGYCKRHLAQRPRGSDEKIRHSRWRYSLMNWGHDPLGRGSL